MTRIPTAFSLIAGCLLVCGFGCQSHEVVPSSGRRSPTSLDQVTIYQKHPRKYERLGTVTQEITPEIRWDERGEATAGFDKLKAQAAALGANGLLLSMEGTNYDMTVTAGYRGQFYQVPARTKPTKAVIAEAIYVIEQ